MLTINNLSKEFKTFALTDISFKVEQGDYFVLLGKSGAGKSVLLEIIAGIIKAEKGTVVLSGNEITASNNTDENIGLVFQDFAIFPHLSVKKNISYSLKSKNLTRKEKQVLTEEYAEKMGILHLLERMPETLSGGELQRVALARTMIMKPDCLLLDEPLSSLDVQLKTELRSLLKKINQNGQTILHVTHDYEDAISLSNKAAILNNGKIIQTGITKDVFKNPVNEFVANFTGIKNFFKAVLIGNQKAVIENQVEVILAAGKDSGSGHVIIKRENIIISKEKIESSAMNNHLGEIVEVIPSKEGYEIIIDIGVLLSIAITEFSFEKLQLAIKKEVWISFKASAVDFLEG